MTVQKSNAARERTKITAPISDGMKSPLKMKLRSVRESCSYKNTVSPLNRTWKRQAMGWFAVEKIPISAFGLG